MFSVSRTRAESPRTGEIHPFYRIDSPDWVNIIPITAAGELVMVRQFRHGLDGFTVETPGGMVDPGETPASTPRAASCSRRPATARPRSCRSAA